MLSLLLLIGSTVPSFAAEFREYPIGDKVEKNSLQIAAVYFPAVAMDHSSMGGVHAQHGVSQAEITKEKFAKPGTELVHLEADIHATAGNPCGFGAGEWIPALPIKYRLTKKGDPKPTLDGELMPMVAKDGPHYGSTIRMPGKGKYTLEYDIGAPQIARHTDPLTGVAEYWKPFTVSYEFEYDGLPH